MSSIKAAGGKKTNKMKRKSLSVADKINILNDVDRNPNIPKKDIAYKYEISPSTLSTILAQRETIENAAVGSSAKSKKLRTAKNEDLENVLAEWFYQARAQDIPLSGHHLKEEAAKIAQQLNIQGFTPNNGWLDRFRKRKGIVYRQISGESQAVDQTCVDFWINEILPNKRQGYTPKDTFNADELGLFFNLLPDKSMVSRTESCHGSKRSKERVTALLCCNMDGSEKLQPVVIGKSEKPRCFKNLKTFPCEWKHQKKAWMTGVIFIEWLKKLDGQMGAKHRKILLFIDRCPAHPPASEFLRNVRVEFLPPNATSKLQPLDMGIIRAVKHYYRKKVVRRLLNLIDRKLDKKDMKINIYQAMHFLAVFDCFNNEDVLDGPLAWLQRLTSNPKICTIIVTSHCAYIQQEAIKAGYSVISHRLYKEPSYLDAIFVYGLKSIMEDLSPNINRKVYVIGFSGFSNDDYMLSLPTSFTRYIIPDHLLTLLSDMNVSSHPESYHPKHTVEYVTLLSNIKSIKEYKLKYPH